MGSQRTPVQKADPLQRHSRRAATRHRRIPRQQNAQRSPTSHRRDGEQAEAVVPRPVRRISSGRGDRQLACELLALKVSDISAKPASIASAESRPFSSAYLRRSAVIRIEQNFGPHIEQKCAVLAGSAGSVSSWKDRADRRTEPADLGGADRAGDVVAGRRHVSCQRPQRVERRLAAEPLLEPHVLGDLVQPPSQPVAARAPAVSTCRSKP